MRRSQVTYTPSLASGSFASLICSGDTPPQIFARPWPPFATAQEFFDRFKANRRAPASLICTNRSGPWARRGSSTWEIGTVPQFKAFLFYGPPKVVAQADRGDTL